MYRFLHARPRRTAASRSVPTSSYESPSQSPTLPLQVGKPSRRLSKSGSLKLRAHELSIGDEVVVKMEVDSRRRERRTVVATRRAMSGWRPDVGPLIKVSKLSKARQWERQSSRRWTWVNMERKGREEDELYCAISWGRGVAVNYCWSCWHCLFLERTGNGRIEIWVLHLLIQWREIIDRS
jgi:hypothetical protein